MGQQYILALDQSTSATKAVIFDRDGKLVTRRTETHRQFYPQSGWVEHDAEEIYRQLLQAVRKALAAARIESRQLAAVAVTNQRETVLVWDKTTGKPVYHAIVWQCGRADAICKQLTARGYDSLVRQKTGLVLSPYFSAPKIKWIFDHVSGVRERAAAGELLLGTMDSWVIWNLTQGQVHATDFSNASRTLLFNIHKRCWDPELLEMFGIPREMLPEVRYADQNFGATTFGSLLHQAVPITGVMGDSHAALFGQNCFTAGMAKTTYGTGSSIMMHIGGEPRASQNGLVTSIAWGRTGRVEYVFEGNINCTGATIQWLVDDLELIGSAKEAGDQAAAVADTGGVYLIPAFVGLGAPYWDSEARAVLVGMTRGTKKAHLVRAAEEAIAYQIKDVIDLMIAESGFSLSELRVDGGPTKDRFLMQFQADMLNVKVVPSQIEELSALGAAYMAGLAVGFWPDLATVRNLRRAGPEFVSQMAAAARTRLYQGWQAAVQKALTNG